MSGYNGRRPPSLSQFLEDLNAIPSPYDQAMQQQQAQQDSFNIDAELALFTNTEFLDFDSLGDVNNMPVPYDRAKEERARRENAAASVNKDHEVKYVDMLNGDFGMQTLPDYTGGSMMPMGSAAGYGQHHSASSGYDLTGSDTTTSPISPPNGILGQSAASKSRPIDNKSLEDQTTRLAADEDKRRRNTAASARFRVKKKQREQALERTVKEVSDENSYLKSKVSQLEMENRWLRGLITEKNGTKATDSEISEQYQKFREDGSTSGPSQAKKGVGTTTA